jgi:5-enolpyruvylshikimate-3-phosphate synthase
MSAKILATTFDQSADITGTESIPTSFPNFDEILTNFIRI